MIFFFRNIIAALVLGQFLSFMLCGTGTTSQYLETNYAVDVPTTQIFINYVLLWAVFGVALATTKRFLKVLKENWWKYLFLGIIDVEANFLVVLGYKYTSLTSIQVCVWMHSPHRAKHFCFTMVYNWEH